MKNIIQILNVVQVAGHSKKTGNDYDMRMAQCVIELHNDDGSPAPLIGELVLPEEFKSTSPGRYDVEFKIAVDRAKRVIAVVSSMTPAPAGRVPSPPASVAAKA